MQCHSFCIRVLFVYRISLAQSSKISNAWDLTQMAWELCISRPRKVVPEMCTLTKRPTMLSSATRNPSMPAITTWCSSQMSKVIRRGINSDGFVNSSHVMSLMFKVTTSAQLELQDIMPNAATSFRPANSSAIAQSKRLKSTSSSPRE